MSARERRMSMLQKKCEINDKQSPSKVSFTFALLPTAGYVWAVCSSLAVDEYWKELKSAQKSTEFFTFSLFSHNSMRRGGMEDSFQAYWVSSCRGALKCLYCCWGKKENVAFNTQSIIFQLLCGFQSYKVEWCVVFFQFTFFPFFLSLLLFAFAFMLHVFPTCFSCFLPLTRFTHFKTLSFFYIEITLLVNHLLKYFHTHSLRADEWSVLLRTTARLFMHFFKCFSCVSTSSVCWAFEILSADIPLFLHSFITRLPLAPFNNSRFAV